MKLCFFLRRQSEACALSGCSWVPRLPGVRAALGDNALVKFGSGGFSEVFRICALLRAAAGSRELDRMLQLLGRLGELFGFFRLFPHWVYSGFCIENLRLKRQCEDGRLWL